MTYDSSGLRESCVVLLCPYENKVILNSNHILTHSTLTAFYRCLFVSTYIIFMCIIFHLWWFEVMKNRNKKNYEARVYPRNICVKHVRLTSSDVRAKYLYSRSME